MNIKERFEFIQKREAEIPEEIEKLERELRRLKSERSSWKFDEWVQIAERWNASDDLVGRPRFVDRENWKSLFEVAPWKFVLVSVEHLRSIGRINTAKTLAKIFSENKFPRTGSSRGATRVFSDGSVEQNFWESIEALDGKPPEPEQEPEQTGYGYVVKNDSEKLSPTGLPEV